MFLYQGVGVWLMIRNEMNVQCNKAMAEVAGWRLPRMQGCRSASGVSLRIRSSGTEAKKADQRKNQHHQSQFHALPIYTPSRLVVLMIVRSRRAIIHRQASYNLKVGSDHIRRP